MRHIIVGVGLAVGAVIVVSGCSSSETPAPKTFTMTGSYENREVSVYDVDVPQASADEGVGCTGFRSSPIAEGKPVLLMNEKGDTVATGKFLPGHWQVDASGSPKRGCVYRWEISNVPSGLEEYRVGVPGHPKNGPYSETQARQPIQLTWK